jgi:hypothetical protein
VTGGFSEDYTSGSLWSTPCAPGFFSIVCKGCPKGYYSTDYSNTDCLRCQNMPKGAEGYYTDTAWTSPMCPYECKEGLTTFAENPQCLSDFFLFVGNLGGIQIFIIIIIATLFGIASVLYFLTIKSKNIKEDDDDNIHQKLKR